MGYSDLAMWYQSVRCIFVWVGNARHPYTWMWNIMGEGVNTFQLYSSVDPSRHHFIQPTRDYNQGIIRRITASNSVRINFDTVRSESGASNRVDGHNQITGTLSFPHWTSAFDWHLSTTLLTDIARINRAKSEILENLTRKCTQPSTIQVFSRAHSLKYSSISGKITKTAIGFDSGMNIRIRLKLAVIRFRRFIVTSLTRIQMHNYSEASSRIVSVTNSEWVLKSKALSLMTRVTTCFREHSWWDSVT